MTRREASEMLQRMIDEPAVRGSRYEQGLVLAKQALDILVTLDENLRLNEPITIENRSFDWRVTRDYRTHLGSDPADALGQLCQTLESELEPLEQP
jgi:hypothetical protein